MIDENSYQNYDDTELAFEEKTEKYYLDKNEHIGVLLPPKKWHKTEIENVMPERFLYENKNKMIESEDYEWKLTYQFSSDNRNPFVGMGQYGNENMSFRRLYIILCLAFNHSYFIDDYFKNVYPFTLKESVENRLKGAKEAILDLVEENARMTRVTKDNKLDVRYKTNRQLKDLISSFDQYESDNIAKIIKEDIKACLEAGIIPLNFRLSPMTIKIRESLGIASTNPLYATGQLIDDLRIFFRLEKKQWQTEQGILV